MREENNFELLLPFPGKKDRLVMGMRCCRNNALCISDGHSQLSNARRYLPPLPPSIIVGCLLPRCRTPPPPHPPSPPVTELLIVAWGLCFIAALRESTPRLKARNFSAPFVDGKKVITNRLRNHSSRTSGPDSEQGHERPHWETAYDDATASADRDASREGAQVISCVP